ncbi:MAG: lipid-A-disaccharide synthase [Planctomyces sp.]
MRIFFSAGEPSGDQHAARLISHLQRLSPSVQVEGFGGPAMRQAGCRLFHELTKLAVMGFLRVLPLVRQFYGRVSEAERHVDESPPDAVVLVDFPGFNWWIARAAKKRGIPVYYYLPPQLWAWAPWRIRKVRRWVDHVLCALPFEYDWYKSRGAACSWVGHPFFDQVRERVLDAEILGQLNSGAGPLVALLPGSRGHEIEKNWPVMMEVVRRLAVRFPQTRWAVGCYRDDQRLRCQKLQATSGLDLPLNYFTGAASEVIESADCCLMVSGSISLELLARRKPGIVLYRVPQIGRFFARFLMLCRWISLPNLMANREVMPEFVSSGDPEPDIAKIVERLGLWLGDRAALRQVQADMGALADRTAAAGASEAAARFLVERLAGTTELKRAA